MKFLIIGAGNGGQSMAAHLTFLKQEVILYDIQEELIKKINDKKGILAEGVINGFANVRATTEIEEAMDNADIIMVTTTSFAHRSVAKTIAPHVRDGQTIMIFPGYWGALEFRNAFQELGVKKKVYISETESLIYTTRAIEVGHVKVRKIKEELHFAALPSKDGEFIKHLLNDVYPQLVVTDTVLTTTLNNCNPIFHVPITLFNAGRIESEGEFYFYPDGATKSIVNNVMEALERERMEIGEKLDINLSSCKDILKRFYKVNDNTLYDSIQNNPAYKTGKAPNTLNYRYIYEDIPYGLCPMYELGKSLGLEMKTMKTLIDVASLLRNEDLKEKAIGMKELGLDGFSSEEIKTLLKG